MKNRIVDKVFIFILIGFVCVFPAFAEDFKSMVLREGAKAMNSGGKVVVFFYTEKPLAATAAQVSAAMKSSNPNAIINKSWVTSIAFRGYDEKKKCGMIVGEWAPGALEEEWESTVFNKVKRTVDIISFQYAKGGDLKTLVGTVGSEGDDIMELCIQ